MTKTIVACLISLIIGAGASWDYTRQHYLAQIATINSNHDKDVADAAEAARKKVLASLTLGNTLTTGLEQTETTLNKKSSEVNREIPKVTTGSTCLNASTVRLLNGSTASDSGHNVSTAASQPDAESGAAATDTDVGGWIANAQRQYETCRARFDALIDFENGETK